MGLGKVFNISLATLLLTLGGNALGRDDPSLVQRVERMERLMNSRSMMEMLTRLDQLQREVQQLRGDMEVQTNTLEKLQTQQRELYQDTDRRLHRLESGGIRSMPDSSLNPANLNTMPQQNGTMPPATVSEEVPPVVAVDPGQERTRYESALNLLKEGRYSQAADAFRQFRSHFPESRYSANAQYWLGESYYVSRDFTTAAVEFSGVVEQFPDSAKVADAMLKRGFIYYEQQNWTAARQELETLVARFPQATAARLARDRLERMTGEGR